MLEPGSSSPPLAALSGSWPIYCLWTIATLLAITTLTLPGYLWRNASIHPAQTLSFLTAVDLSAIFVMGFAAALAGRPVTRWHAGFAALFLALFLLAVRALVQAAFAAV
ncbi:hypothetical protein ETAA8_02170 [Anatilimnocola aggregata]|uniref:Uncharacterized protein n=1 Tax=Anatilimnocola aggregata TaxID=2528021 RepID=A0A517Y4J6_9BACT|nr:hypothetical protein [Anatilimnocola aggregata]QDU25155.1 hypothetical protein ETAA8_02170 [Anatilimnocola aggregata]